MAQSIEASMFEDVGTIQGRLEELLIMDFDANRIYDRLEAHIEENDRIDIVLQEILAAIGPTNDIVEDMFNDSRDITALEDSSSNDTIELENSMNDGYNSDDVSVVTPIPETREPEVEINHDANNNKDLDLPTVIPLPTREQVLAMESKRIHSIVPQVGFEKIRDYLILHEHVPNRVDSVVGLCLAEVDNDDPVEVVPNDDARPGCSHHQTPPPRKRRQVMDVETIKNMAMRRISDEIDNMAKSIAMNVADEPDTETEDSELPEQAAAAPQTVDQDSVVIDELLEVLKDPGPVQEAPPDASEVPGPSRSEQHTKTSTVSKAPDSTLTFPDFMELTAALGLKRSVHTEVSELAACGSSAPKKARVPGKPVLRRDKELRRALLAADWSSSSDDEAFDGLDDRFGSTRFFRRLFEPGAAAGPTAAPAPPTEEEGPDEPPLPAEMPLPEEPRPEAAALDVADALDLPVPVAAVPDPPRVPHKYLKTVQDMFPEAEVAFLERCCNDLLADENINHLIERLLEMQDMPLRPPPPPVIVAPMSPNQQMASLQALQEILPDADPEYLRRVWTEMGHNQEQLKVFVSDQLEFRKYPTLKEYKQREKIAALREKLTEKFSAKEFLEEFPDPFTHFKNLSANSGDKLSYNLHEGRSFLIARFTKIRCIDIDRCYKNANYRILEACEMLESHPVKLMKSVRKNYEIPLYKSNLNVQFLQEIAFIENKDKIREYLDQKEEERKKMFEEAKLKGELLECSCCYDNEFLIGDMGSCNDGHLFCKDCIRKGAEVQIGDGKTDVPCFTNCEQVISLRTLKGILAPSVFQRLDQRKQVEEVMAAGIEDLESCPSCDYTTIPPRDDKVFKCLNPDCMKESCRLCKEPNHIPLRCNEVEKSEEIKLRTYIEDRMTEALVRTCYRCKKKFIKEDGCNKMTCTCGALMCYLCRQPVKDYTHFNGQGGDAIEKCPLYSNNDQLHVEAVRNEAQKAKEEVEAQNPTVTLRHDPTMILPEARQPANRGAVPRQPGRNIQRHGANIPRNRGERQPELFNDVYNAFLRERARQGLWCPCHGHRPHPDHDPHADRYPYGDWPARGSLRALLPSRCRTPLRLRRGVCVS